MIKILENPPASIVDRLMHELSGLVPGQAFVYRASDHSYVASALAKLKIKGSSEPTDNKDERIFYTIAAKDNLPYAYQDAYQDDKIKSMLPRSRRDIMRRLHLSASQVDDAVSRLGLVIISNRPVVYKMP